MSHHYERIDCRLLNIEKCSRGARRCWRFTGSQCSLPPVGPSLFAALTLQQQSLLTAQKAIAGWFADRSSSRQAPFLIGLALTFGATILFAKAVNPAFLIIARCLQGASAGIVYTVGLALLVDTVGRDGLGQWMGFVMMGLNIGTLVGPLLGGVIYTKLGYWSVFIVVLAVVGFDFLLRVFMIEKVRAAKWSQNPSRIYTTYGSVSQNVAQGRQGQADDHCSYDGRSSTSEESSLVSGHSSSMSAGGAGREKSIVARHFPIMASLVGSKRLMSAVYGSFINTTLTCAFDGVLPLFVRKVFGWNATAAGLVFLTIAVPSILGPLAGALSDRVGPRPVSLAGFALATPAVALLGLVKHNDTGQVVLLCTLLAVVGIGNSMVYAPLAADMSAEIDAITLEEPELFKTGGAYAQAFGLFDGAIALGTVVGPVWAGFIYHETSWAVMAGTLALICASGTVPVVCIPLCLAILTG